MGSVCVMYRENEAEKFRTIHERGGGRDNNNIPDRNKQNLIIRVYTLVSLRAS